MIQTKEIFIQIQKILRLHTCSHWNEFQKWRAIRASVGGVGSALAWGPC